MQDIYSIGGGRLFSGGGDRQLRPHPHHQNHQALNCPRCDSLNTKFCYYNNYNLSQPRHFCKNCRRYWTKGGVLRNVPVGGGCRKTKRNSKTKPSPEPSAQTETQTPASGKSELKTNSHSSSESSSTLTVNNNNNNQSTNVEAVTSVHSSSSALSSVNNNLTKFLGHAVGNNGNNIQDPGFDQPVGSSDCGIFSEIGSFTNLITSSNESVPYVFSNWLNNTHQNFPHTQNEQWRQQQHHKMQDLPSGLLDQTAQVELPALQVRSGNDGGFGLLDWQGSDDQGLFDIPNAVDHDASYWSQSTQWTDQDHPVLHLP